MDTMLLFLITIGAIISFLLYKNHEKDLQIKELKEENKKLSDLINEAKEEQK